MTRPSYLLVLFVLALAGGVWWIATGTGPTGEAGAENTAREEGVARAASPQADLATPPARPGPQTPEEDAAASAPTPASEKPTTPPRRTSATVEKHALRFRLEDDRGEPIKTASFTYKIRGGEDEAFERTSNTGEFLLADLPPGEVLVVVDTFIHDPQQRPAWHAVPGYGETIVLTFDRRASITGRVVDDAGVLITELSVYLERGRDTVEERRNVDHSDTGEFSFSMVRPGPVTLTSSNGFVSAELELVLAVGEVLEGVELRLEGGGTVTGRVLDAASQPAAGVDVIIVDAADFRAKTKTDEEGAFRLGPILPGTYEVTTILKENANANVFDQILSETVTVVRGGVVDLLLQPKQETPVVLKGHVLYGGEKLGDCVVYGFREDEKLLNAVRMARSNDEGEYELKLGGPGAYVFMFEPRENRSNSPTAPLRAVIPDAAEVRMDLAVPASSIRGRVLNADGEPVSGAFVVALPADDYLDFELPDARVGSGTGREGTFSIPYLRAGEYVVRATRQDSELAWEPLEGVHVDEGAPTDVELRATQGGTVTGTVRGPDGPAAGASVYVHDAAGHILFVRGTETDASGTFHIRSIPEGEVTLTARSAGLASPASDKKRARAGEETTFELRLGPASFLTATAVDASGAAASCSIHVLDASGRDVTRVTSSERAAGNFTDALSTTTKTVGPLPAGEYEVVATTRDGRRGSRRVKVDGKRPTDVEVRL